MRIIYIRIIYIRIIIKLFNINTYETNFEKLIFEHYFLISNKFSGKSLFYAKLIEFSYFFKFAVN